MPEDRFVIEHHAEEGRYVLLDRLAAPGQQVIGEEGYVDVDGADRPLRVLYHTWISEDYGGQGLASRLVREVVEDVIAGGRNVVPVCPYVAKWLPKHQEYAEQVVPPTREHFRAVQERVSGDNR